MELDEDKYSAYANVVPGVSLSDYFKTAESLILRADLANDRRTRAGAITALKRAIERHYGVKLVRVSGLYDETYGFLPRTEIRYEVEK
jgi:hypothetical protein